MNPLDALFTLSEVAIALAGFIAIATVLQSSTGSSNIGARIRVINLLLVSFGLLFVCQIAIALSYAGLSEHIVWRISSLLWLFVTIPTAIYNLNRRSIFAATGIAAPRVVMWVVFASIALMLILQVANMVLLGLFWPFFAGTILILAIGALSFSILVIKFLRQESGSDNT